MVYLNNNDGLYYTDEQFTTVANGFFADVLYVNGSRSFYQFAADSSFPTGSVSIVRNNGLYYTDDALTNLANGRIDGVADSFVGQGVSLPGSSSISSGRYVYFIDGQITGLHFDGSGYWNEELHVYGVADFTGPYAGAQGATEGFYVNGVKTTLDLWGGHGVWNNKIYGSYANETHLDGFTGYIQTNNYGGFTQLTDLTGVDFSSVVSVAGANFTGVDLSGLDFSRFTDWSGVQFGCTAKVVGANFSGVNFTNNGTVYSNLCFDDASGADFSGAQIGDFYANAGLVGVNFSNAVFTGDITYKNFFGANLAGADFSGVPYYPMGQGSAPQFDGATDITGTIFPVNFVGLVNGTWRSGSSVTNLNYAIIQYADLTGVDFSNVTSMVGADFTGSNLAGADLSNVTNMAGAKFNGCDLLGIDFGTSDMTGVEFYGTDLTGSNFSQTNGLGAIGYDPNGSNRITNLSQVILPSNISGINFTVNGLELINLTGADFSNVTNMAGIQIGNGGYNGQALVDLTGADFSNVTNMAGAYFYGVNLAGASFNNNISGIQFDIVNITNISFPNGLADISNVRFNGDIQFDSYSDLNLNVSNYSGLSFRSARFKRSEQAGSDYVIYAPSNLSLMSADAFEMTEDENYSRFRNGSVNTNPILDFRLVNNPNNPSIASSGNGLSFRYANLSNLDSSITYLYSLDLRSAILPSDLSGKTFYNCVFSVSNVGNAFGSPTDFSVVTNMDNATFDSIYPDMTGLDFSNVTTATGLQFLNGTTYTGAIAGTYYLSGAATTLDSSGTGWDSNSSVYYISGVATTLPESGTGWESSNSVYYVSGVATTLPESGTGWDSNSSVYYVSGVATTLPESGTGWDSNGGIYYIAGAATELDSSGNGTYNGQTYVNGVVQGGGGDNGGGGGIKNGWVDGVYYINDVATELNSDGHGTWNGKVYYNGSIRNGYDPMASMIAGQWGYYIDGVVTELDNEGNGEWNGQTYVNGVVQGGGGDNGGGGGIKNGWVDGVYYINDVATELNSDGHGTWNGKVYYNGSIRNGYDPMASMIAGQWGYYIDGVVTELDNEGNGEWNGQTYVNGVVQGGGDGTGGGGSIRITGKSKFFGRVKFAAGANDN